MRILVAIIIIIIVILLAIYVWLRLRLPLCGGNVDPNMMWCDGARPVTGSPIPAGCDDTSSQGFYVAQVLRYLTRLSEQTRPASTDAHSLAQVFSDQKTYQGFLLFAVPELLKVLPTDFGQNYTTPYGIVSFYDAYIPCMSKVESFCRYLLKDSGEALKLLCVSYFESRKAQAPGGCPFEVTDKGSDEALVENPDFFNSIGLLGAYSLKPHQVVVFYTDLPVADLGLNYWSYMLYVADSLDPNSRCSPSKQVYFASVSSALNMFPANASTR